MAALGVVASWLFPRAVHQTLSNGGGDIIRRIVSDENAKHTAVQSEKLDARFTKHEAAEDRRF